MHRNTHCKTCACAPIGTSVPSEFLHSHTHTRAHPQLSLMQLT